MTPDPASTHLLIEIVLPPDVAREIPEGSKYAVATARLIPVILRLRVREGPPPPQVTLTGVRLWSEDSHYERTFVEETVALDEFAPVDVRLSDGAVFPFAGLYWLDASVQAPAGFTIETNQLTFEDNVGRGWSFEDRKTHWRSGIIAVDVLALTQARLNRLLCWLTIVATAATVLQAAPILWSLLRPLVACLCANPADVPLLL